MTKEELKALTIIENYQVVVDIEKDKTSTIKELLPNSCKTIETALKEYELMKQTKIIVADKDISDEDLEKLKNQIMLVVNLGQCEIKPLFDEETQKKLKALEIIKKIVCITSDGFFEETIGFRTLKEEDKLTQEEFDLLKEALL